MDDPDDIIRDIDETNQDTCNREIVRLLRKKRGLKSSFTRSVNSLGVLVTNAKGENTFDRSALHFLLRGSISDFLLIS